MIAQRRVQSVQNVAHTNVIHYLLMTENARKNLQHIVVSRAKFYRNLQSTIAVQLYRDNELLFYTLYSMRTQLTRR